MLIARAMCGLKHVTVAALCSSSSLLCISNSDWATENEARRSVSVKGNEEPAGEIVTGTVQLQLQLFPNYAQ